MSNVHKQAARDAEEFAKAYLSYGEGAGTRRKLINATIEYKKATVPGYQTAFENYAEKQDMAAYAKQAKRADRRKTINQAVAKNTKALVTGKYENINTGLLIVAAGAVIMHQTGYDKKLVEATKRKYREVKNRFGKKSHDTVYVVTNL